LLAPARFAARLRPVAMDVDVCDALRGRPDVVGVVNGRERGRR